MYCLAISGSVRRKEGVWGSKFTRCDPLASLPPSLLVQGLKIMLKL